MQYSTIISFFLTLATPTLALPSTLIAARGPSFGGICTFNDYVDQVEHRNQPTVCQTSQSLDYHDVGSGPTAVFGAAAGDLSPNISAGKCYYSPSDSAQDMSVCTQSDSQGANQQPDSSKYTGPGCPAKCGTCYTVKNNNSGMSVTIKIIDACPAQSAYNYCKTLTPAAGKCAAGTNALDISVNAYPYLVSGGSASATDNLNNLSITPLSSCPA